MRSAGAKDHRTTAKNTRPEAGSLREDCNDQQAHQAGIGTTHRPPAGSDRHGCSRRCRIDGARAGAFAQSTKTGTVRVWGEPGPYGGVAVAAMNEWAQKNAPGLKFEIESIPWDGVYVKLMTDLAAKRPPSLHQRGVAHRHAADGRGPADTGRRPRRQDRPQPPRRWREVGILGRLEGQAVHRSRTPPAASAAGAHGHRQGAGPQGPRHLGLERPAQRGQDDLAEEARHGRLLHGARPQPVHRLSLRRAAAFGRRQDVRRRQQVRGGLRQPADGRGAHLRQGAAALHAERCGRVQLPAGGGRARDRPHGDEFLLGPHARARRRGGQAGVRGHGSLQPRAPSDDQAAQQLERLPGLVHPGAEQSVHRRGAGRRWSTSRPARTG